MNKIKNLIYLNNISKTVETIVKYFIAEAKNKPVLQNNVLVGKPFTKILGSKIKVLIPYYLPKIKGDRKKINILLYLLDKLCLSSQLLINETSLFITKISSDEDKQKKESDTSSLLKMEIQLVRLQYPYLDSHILAQYFSINADKYNFTRLQKIFYNKVPVFTQGTWVPCDQSGKVQVKKIHIGSDTSTKKDKYNRNTSDLYQSLPASTVLRSKRSEKSEKVNPFQEVLPFYFTGLKMQVAGRLTTQRSVPRKTVTISHTGSFAQNDNAHLDFSQYTSKNKLGAFTIKVWLNNKCALK